ncbi:MAG TPA: S1 family peptidase [Arthrobacter sp.]|nr:S1 family peptidase [Arthrobacter sp.]
MKTPRFQLTVRAVAAAAIALAGSFYAVPAVAEGGGSEFVPAALAAASPSATASPPAPATAAAPATAPEVSDAGLAEAVRRDLGMTLEEFNAAGQLARTAADAVPSLRDLPGYLGISLQDGKIHVEGSGADLQARVKELNGAGTAALFVLVTPGAGPSAEPTAAPATQPSAAREAAPAAVPSAADLVASSTEQLFQAYVREVGPAALQAVAYSGGRFIIRTGGKNAAEAALPAVLDPEAATTDAAPGKISPADFVARYANVQLEQGSPVTTEADVYGGEGYAIDRRTICSTGFGAFNAAGLPVVLTAGHCAEDGTARNAELEPPTSATAGGSAPLPGTLAPLGTFGFSQFGGTLNSWITGTDETPGNVGTDIALIEALNGGINVQPATTNWANATNPGPTAVKIIGVVAPFEGQAVCRSGRTTGWSCGTVAEVGTYVVGGRTTDPADLRAFKGFLSNDVQSSGGDSGGPWISGNFAVGTHSAGETSGENFAIATTLQDALTKFPTAVELQLFLNKPELVAPENLTFKAGQPITGRVPAAPAAAVAAASRVRITVEGQQPADVPVDPSGNWSFPAPATAGALRFTAETVNGFSTSGAVSLAVDVSDLDAPVIGAPEGGAALMTLSRIDGTGTPGLTVKLTGDISGSAAVQPDGRWSIPVGVPAYGQLAVHAVQTSDGVVDSPSITQTFTVIPPMPAETTIPDGTRFSQDALPETISGTGVDGADVTVSIDGIPVGAAQAGAGGAGVGARAVVRSLVPQVLVAGGRWSVPFPAGLTPGSHTLAVTQSVDGVASAARLVTFTIEAPPAALPAAPAEPDVPAAAAPVLPAGTGQLPNTGAGSLLPAAGLAGGAILLGGVLLGSARVAAARRRPVR